MRLNGLRGWWAVDAKEGTSLTCIRKVGRQEEFRTTHEDQVIQVSNKRTKGKRK